MKSIVVLVVLCSILSFGQEEVPYKKHFIGLSTGIQSADIGHLTYGLAYGYAFHEKCSFNVSANYNSFRSDNLMTASLLFETDTTQIYRSQEQFNKTISLNAGIVYAPIPYLKFGADMIIGYDQNHLSIHDRNKGLDVDEGNWVWDYYQMGDLYPDLFTRPEMDVGSAVLRREYAAYLGYSSYLVTGGALSVSGCWPIGEFLELALTYRTSFARYTHLNNNSLASELNDQGINVYPNFGNFNSPPASFNLWNHSLSAGIGFKF